MPKIASLRMPVIIEFPLSDLPKLIERAASRDPWDKKSAAQIETARKFLVSMERMISLDKDWRLTELQLRYLLRLAGVSINTYQVHRLLLR